ncbi:hypothetical protein F511_09093 [Dorcoceras hygrometricum]|nr:hypothetical protein F511_09093 [Dorcoceras hygrometricum]
MTFRVVRTNQYNQDLGLIHSTNGNHLESPNEGSSIDHQVTIYLHAQNITMFPTNETWVPYRKSALIPIVGPIIRGNRSQRRSDTNCWDKKSGLFVTLPQLTSALTQPKHQPLTIVDGWISKCNLICNVCSSSAAFRELIRTKIQQVATVLPVESLSAVATLPVATQRFQSQEDSGEAFGQPDASNSSIQSRDYLNQLLIYIQSQALRIQSQALRIQSQAEASRHKYPVDKETAVARSVVTKNKQQLSEQLLNNQLKNIQPSTLKMERFNG